MSTRLPTDIAFLCRQRHHAFTVFARQNSHVFAATSAKDEQAWRDTIAPAS